MCKVDRVAPCHNYAHYLQGFVHSVLSQTKVEVRAFVIDNTYSDDMVDVGNKLVASAAG
jgi:hypothetical protein